MKKLNLFFLVLALMVGFTSVASAQTATGTLTVNATVAGSINLVFKSDVANGVALTSGEGQSAATLDFGSISAFGNLKSTNITRTLNPGVSFTVSTPVDVQVDKTNSASANFNLSARLGTADANTWFVGPVTLSTTDKPVNTNATYGQPLPETIGITVPFSAPSGNISNTITFTATAN